MKISMRIIHTDPHRDVMLLPLSCLLHALVRWFDTIFLGPNISNTAGDTDSIVTMEHLQKGQLQYQWPHTG